MPPASRCIAALGLAAAAAGPPAAGAAETWSPPPAGAALHLQYDGEPPARVQAAIIDVDLFDTPAAAIERWRQQGLYVVCYLNAGALETWRPDADAFPLAVVGRAYVGWPDEFWLDIRALDLLGPVLEDRLDLARARGCDGVDPDNLDGYENDTGFDLTAADAVAFARWLAAEAHERGLAIGLKNLPELVPVLEPSFDWALTEDCAVYGWCGAYAPFLAAGKAVFHVEYTDMDVDFAAACAAFGTGGATVLLKRRELDAWTRRCPAARR